MRPHFLRVQLRPFSHTSQRFDIQKECNLQRSPEDYRLIFNVAYRSTTRPTGVWGQLCMNDAPRMDVAQCPAYGQTSTVTQQRDEVAGSIPTEGFCLVRSYKSHLLFTTPLFHQNPNSPLTAISASLCQSAFLIISLDPISSSQTSTSPTQQPTAFLTSSTQISLLTPKT